MTELSEARVKELIMAEVSKQIKPLHEWQLAFWSNGSGRVPGFFQTRIKADDERYGKLQAETVKQSEVLDRLDTNMQQIAAEKKAEAERVARRKERIAFWMPYFKWVLGSVGTVLLGLTIWLYHVAAPVVKILWEDYLRSHPVVTEQMKHLSSSDQKIYATAAEGRFIPRQ